MVCLSTFDGVNPNGVWTLQICDGAGADTGTLTGWSIQVLSPAAIPHNFNTVSVSSPSAGTPYNVSTVVPVTALFRNLGSTAEASPVKYRFDNGTTITENTANLASFATENHTFGTSITTPATPGSYVLKVWTDLATDGDRTNDTVTVNVGVATVSYSDDFETSGGLWESDNTSGWQWGVPTVEPSGAHSPTHCWGTVMNADYPASACFNLTLDLDLTVASAASTIEFWMWYSTEQKLTTAAISRQVLMVALRGLWLRLPAVIRSHPFSVIHVSGRTFPVGPVSPAGGSML